MNLSKVVILDVETSGTHDGAQCLEVGAVLYSVTDAAAIRPFASLIHAHHNPVEHINKIPIALLETAPPAEEVWPLVAAMIVEASAVIAHNAEFDQRFVPTEVQQGRPWICSMDGLEWPRASHGRSLTSIAEAHGIDVAHAHRAAADCEIIVQLLGHVAARGTDLEAFLTSGLRPRATFKVLAGFRLSDVRAAGFRWHQREFPKAWTKRMAIADAARLPFRTQQVGR